MTRLRVGVLRALPVGVGVFLVFLVVNTLPAVLVGRDVVVFTVLLPFLAAAVCAFGVRAVLGPVDRFVERVTRLRATTPYSVLAEAAARTRTGMLDTALPGLAEVLAGGTAARRAVIWVVVSDRLVAAAVHPPPSTPFPEVANIDHAPLKLGVDEDVAFHRPHGHELPRRPLGDLAVRFHQRNQQVLLLSL